MEDKTTTDASTESNGQQINGIAVDDQGQAIPVTDDVDTSTPADTAPASEPSADEEVITETTGAESAQPDVDDKLQKYATSQGLELDSPNAVKAARIAMNNQAEVTRNYHKTSELEKSMTQMSDDSAEQVAQATGENPEVLKRIQRMEVKNSINDFWASNPEARDYESQMTEIASSAGLYGTPEAILKASYAMAKAQDSDNLVSQGKRQALESLRDKQQAAVPRGNAVNSAPQQEAAISPQNVDALVRDHDLKWFEANRDAINRAMAG